MKVLIKAKPSIEKMQNVLKDKIKAPKNTNMHDFNDTKWFNETIAPILKIIFHTKSYKTLFSINFDNKTILINKSLSKPIMNDLKQDLINQIKRTDEYGIDLKVHSKSKDVQNEIIDNKAELIEWIINNTDDFKFDTYTSKPSANNIDPFNDDQRQKALIEQSIDKTFNLSQVSSIKASKKVESFIQKYSLNFPDFVNDIDALKERGVLFSLQTMVFPYLLIPFMEIDARVKLPILFDDPVKQFRVNLYNRIMLFLDQNIKQTIDDKDKGFVVVDSYSLVSMNYDVANSYHWSFTEIETLLSSAYIPDFNIEDVKDRIKQNEIRKRANAIGKKYDETRSIRIIVGNNARCYVIEVAYDIKDTYLRQQGFDFDE